MKIIIKTNDADLQTAKREKTKMKKLFLLICTFYAASMMAQTKIDISVGGKTFIATLLDNETAKEFVKRLPVTLNMHDFNNNEKTCTFETGFSGTLETAGTIHAGDLKIWTGKGLVLFYKSFSSAYSYFNLGSIDDATGLAEVVGSGAVSVSFSVHTTGIKKVTNTKSFYDIQNLKGIRVAQHTTLDDARRTLNKGIYICNGRKIVIE